MSEPARYKDYTYSGPLGAHIGSYVAEKRAGGCLYNTEAKKLSEFSRMTMDFDIPENTLPQEAVNAWTVRRPNDADKTVYSRFTVIKGFAEYMRRQGFEAYIPQTCDLPKLNCGGYVPYIFTHEEIARFFAVYGNGSGERTAYLVRFRTMMKMVFEILYCCGLRMSEALNLRTEDVDAENGILTVRFAKFEKSRYVPMSADLADDMRAYMRENLHEPYLFPNSNGKRMAENSVYNEFRRVLSAAGIAHLGRGKGPRVHDLRHTFACHCLQKWAENNTPISSALPRLSTYLGHNDMAATERYLRMTAEVYPEISERLSLDYGHVIPKEVLL